jgi:hypothetical protein
LQSPQRIDPGAFDQPVTETHVFPQREHVQACACIAML